MKVASYILIIILTLSGCAPKVVSIYNHEVTNKNPNSFLVNSANEYSSRSVANQKIDSLLQAVISQSLSLKGLKISAVPDLYVSYVIDVHTSSETQQDNYSPYNRYSYNYPYNYSTRNYKEGLLIIDIKNNRGKLIWQGSRTFKIRSKQSVEMLLPEICREIMIAYKLDAEK